MAIINVGGAPLLGGTLCLPRVGVWHMDAVVDSVDQLSGAVKVQIGDELELSGTVMAGAPYTETGYYRIAGGAGSLSKMAKAKAYGQCQLRLPLTDLLNGVGEQLDQGSSVSALNVQLGAWSTLGVPAGRQLAALLQATPDGTSWRVLPSGAIWVGTESWPTADVDFEELGLLPHEFREEITTEAPTLLPGTSLGGRHVSYVEHRIDSGKLRTLVLLDTL